MNEKLKKFLSKNNKSGIIFIIVFSLIILFGIVYFVFFDYLNMPAFISGPSNYHIDTNTSSEEGLEEEEVQEEKIFIDDIEIKFIGTPKAVSDRFNLVKPDDEGDLDDNVLATYKTGTINNGTYGDVDLKGCELYVQIYQYFSYRFIYCGDEKNIFLISLESGMEDAEGFPYPDNEENVVVTENSDDNSNHFLYDNTEFGSVLRSESGHEYFAYELIMRTYSRNQLKEVDEIGGDSIYNLLIENGGESIIRTKEGFYQRLVLKPGIIKAEDYQSDPTVEINLLGDESFSGVYDYVSIGNCSGNSLEIEEIPLSDLTKVGTGINGDNIYQTTDRNNAYLKKVYEEDYTNSDFELYDKNSISDDDNTPYSYEKFVNSYPVIYWVDHSGRVIKFARRDFIITGGCAKPVLYLYPEKEISLNVQVIPNGQIRFSYPKYPSNGWNIIASVGGDISYNGEIYPYLWWETVSNGFITPTKGWIVEKGNFSAKTTEVLSKYGLNDLEIKDFLKYWVSEINKESDKYIFFTFLLADRVDQIEKIKFSINPESLIRVFMLYKPLSEYREVSPLDMDTQERNGFTAVEWGGARLW